MGFIKPADGKGGRAKILPPTVRQAFTDAESTKTTRSIVYDIVLFPLIMALLIACVSPEPLPLSPPDPSVSWPKSVCSLGWCNCTRINEVPSTAELAAVSYGRRGYNYLDVLRPIVVKDGLKVMCNCTSGQEVDFDHHSLPPETLEVEIQGCTEVRFKAGSLSRPASLTSLIIRSSARISFKKNLYIPTGHHQVSPVPLSHYYSSRDPYRSRHGEANVSEIRRSTRSPDRGPRKIEGSRDASLRDRARVARGTRPSTRSTSPYPRGIHVPPPRETQLDISDAQSVLWESGAFRTVLGGGIVPSLASQGADPAAAIAAVHPRPPLSVRVHRVGHVLVDATTFGRLSAFHASEVHKLELREHAFSVESAPAILASLEGSAKNGPLTTVFLRGVNIPWIPRHAFPSSATEVRLESSEVQAVRRDAFSALTFSGISVSDSKLREVESGAFSGRTLCQRLSFHRVHVGKLSRNAVHSAVNHLSVTHSWIRELGGGAFNLTLASASITDNVFEVVRTRGFSMRDWDRVTLHNNTFLRLEPGSFSGLVVSDPWPELEGQEDASASSSSSTLLQVYSMRSGAGEGDFGSDTTLDSRTPVTADTTEPKDIETPSRDPRRRSRRHRRYASRPRELNITDNVFGDTPAGSLSLLPLGRIQTPASSGEDDEPRPVAMLVSDNRFRYGCRCGMAVWLKGLTEDGTNDDAEALDEEEEPSPRVWSRSLYNTSMCLVDSDLARCFNVSVGFMRMRDFALLVCPIDKETGEEKEGGAHPPPCDPEEDNPAVHKAVVVVVPDTAAGAGGVDVSTVDLGDVGTTENELERDKKILNTIFVAVVICICVIVLVTWVRRTQWWKRVRERSRMTEAEGEEEGDRTCWIWTLTRMRVLMMSPARRANGAAVGGTAGEEEDGISGTDSITRLAVEGYNEMMEREAEENGTAGKKSTARSRLGMGNTEGSGLLVPEGEEEEGTSDAEDVEREDKATQTMPEELTHELLMALREKLDDPENYSEARDMIEHLYDIIKVEEEREMEEKRREASRRARSVATDDEDDEEDDDEEEDNLYDVIQPRPQSGTGKKVGKRRRGRHREATTYNSVGTRAPSPDKLEPVLTASASLASLASIASIVSPLGSPMPQRGAGGGARKRRPAPKAPAVCEYVEPKDRAQHLYTELPSNGVAEASDPRPPRLRLKDEQSAAQPSTSRSEDKAPDPPPPPSVPFKFLRALGETFLTPNKPPRAPPPPAPKPQEARGKSNGGIVCEYTEPTDARVHVYTELPLSSSGQANSSPSSQGQIPASMANRPLPHKPDSPDAEAPKPSVSFNSR